MNGIAGMLICFLHPGGMHRSVEISPQTKATCGAAMVFQVICGNPHVMHKEMWFLPSDAFLTECE
jgi:aspartate carbamoyltransferase catalytic subunit